MGRKRRVIIAFFFIDNVCYSHVRDPSLSANRFILGSDDQQRTLARIT